MHTQKSGFAASIQSFTRSVLLKYKTVDLQRSGSQVQNSGFEWLSNLIIHLIWESQQIYFSCIYTVSRYQPLLFDEPLKTQCQDEVRILSGRTQKLKVAKRYWKQLNEHNLMYIYHKQCENMQKIQRKSLSRLRQELCAENPKNKKNKRN